LHVVLNRAKSHLVCDERPQWLFSVCFLNAVKEEHLECHASKSYFQIYVQMKYVKGKLNEGKLYVKFCKCADCQKVEKVLTEVGVF